LPIFAFLGGVDGVDQGRLGAALAQLVGLDQHVLVAGLDGVRDGGHLHGHALGLGVDPQH